MVTRPDFEDLARAARREGIERLVVGAVIAAGRRVLLLKRPRTDFMGGIFELPSGGVEEGESLEAALAREVLEETGLTIRAVTGNLGSFDYPSKGGRSTRQLNFTVEVDDSEPVALQEHDSHVWALPGELGVYPVTEEVSTLLSRYWADAPDRQAPSR